MKVFKLTLFLLLALMLVLLIAAPSHAQYYGSRYYSSSYYPSYGYYYTPNYYTYPSYYTAPSTYCPPAQQYQQPAQYQQQRGGDVTDQLLKELLLRKLLKEAGGEQALQKQEPLSAEELNRLRQLLKQ